MDLLSIPHKQRIAEELLGTTDSIIQALERYDLSSDYMEEVEAFLASIGIEECQKCGTWCNTNELADVQSHGVKHCVECRCYDCEDH